jgi:galactokinase
VIRTFRAPGRVNLIGEHTDYTGGFVFPAALDLFCDVRAEPASDGKLVASSRNLGEERSWSLADLPCAQPRRDWSDYVAGVAVELCRLGVKPVAARLAIDSSVPIGAGLSSSASIEVSVGVALASLAGVQVPLKELALACQRAENNFVGMKCGIMDQFVAVFGEAGHAILIDCRSLEHTAVPVPPGLQLLVVNSMVKHALASSEYNTRRRECEEAVEILGRPLRDITAAEWPLLESGLPETLRRRARHVVTENARVLEFVEACRQNDPAKMGRLMAESHRSMRDDYQISCVEIDYLVEAAAAQRGVAGARMTGGGFGGCTVNLVRNDAVESFRAAVASAYKHSFDITPEIYVCRTADGARELQDAPSASS